ncbi:MAG: hypothetical protein EZS28_039657 [Streblomastix strix]|uniref:Uncharacterized protein n=1 Tax=Streblomastix strix TaxID=222440 RepID=A0A5J4U596_9EUKA|nr:MAG: hypothetical protein EZS28_039657 [Streblomastix strix]
MKKEGQIEFDKKQQAKNQQQSQPQQSQMEKDPEVNENQTQRRQELKTPISLTQYDQDNQINPNLDLNYISTQHITSHKLSSPHPQQHSASLSLEETLAILRTISPGDPRGYKEREPEPIQPKLQQYAGLMDVIERFHEIMKPIIEDEKKNLQIMLPGQYKHYPNKDGPLFSYPLKNYRPTPEPRPKDLNWANLPKGSYVPGLLNVSNGVAGFINIHSQIYQSILEAVIGLITFAAEQIIEPESQEQEQLTRELERIVADVTDENGDSDQSQHAIEPKHFTNGNDGLRKNDCGMQLQATVNGEANPEINITKTSANTPPHNVKGSDGLGGNGCGMQLQAATNDNGHENHQAIDNTGNEDDNEQVNDNRIGGQQQQNSQESNNETQHQQDRVNNKPGEIGSPQTTHSEQELRNPTTSQPKVQPPLITTPPIPVQYFSILLVVQLIRLVSLGIRFYFYLVVGIECLFLFLGSYTGLVAFEVFCGLVYSNWGYICLFSLLLLGSEVVKSVRVGSSFGTPQGFVRYGL